MTYPPGTLLPSRRRSGGFSDPARVCSVSIKEASHEKTRRLRRGTQFSVPIREELLTVCMGMRGDAGQVK